MKKCKFCNKEAKENMQGYCQSCYRYFVLEHKKEYPLPRYGEITYAENGDCICPFCGKAFTKLGMHFYYHHGMTSREAHIKAGWDIGAKATNENYRNKMRDKVQEKCITINLLEKGKPTRFTKDTTPKRINRSEMSLNRLREKGKYLGNSHKK